MSHDIVIRGGTVVDGTDAEPFEADVAIDGDQITAIGKVEEKGKDEISAQGAHVSPGFIDLHTHLDAHIGWDPQGYLGYPGTESPPRCSATVV